MTRPAWLTGKTPLKILGWGAGFGIMATVLLVLASGFMIESTNTDTFCVRCHYMHPFRDSWRASVHGGSNPRGVVAQCVDCHLPHDNYIQYLVIKAKTGAGHIYNHLSIDPYTYDWAGKAEANRQEFTFDSACRACHMDLTPPGMRRGGFIAHRAKLRGETDMTCSKCHPHVGHRDMLDMVERYFSKGKAM